MVNEENLKMVGNANLAILWKNQINPIKALYHKGFTLLFLVTSKLYWVTEVASIFYFWDKDLKSYLQYFSLLWVPDFCHVVHKETWCLCLQAIFLLSFNRCRKNMAGTKKPSLPKNIILLSSYLRNMTQHIGNVELKFG